MHINVFSQIYMKLVTIPSSIFCALKYTSFSFFPITNILVSSAIKTKSFFIDIFDVLLAFTKSFMYMRKSRVQRQNLVARHNQ